MEGILTATWRVFYHQLHGACYKTRKRAIPKPHISPLVAGSSKSGAAGAAPTLGARSCTPGA